MQENNTTKIMYTITIKDRGYAEWIIQPKCCIEFNPFEKKLFTEDLFVIHHQEDQDDQDDDQEEEINIIHSSIRNTTQLAGVLILKNNKTYGRAENGKLLYKCVPDNAQLPCFLIPYEMKNMGFSKVFSNQYITFEYQKWTEKFPQGKIVQLIGSVDDVDHFYEYQLYCKHLNFSINKFKKDTSVALQKAGANSHFFEILNTTHAIEDRTLSHKVFSIDGESTQDYDDAFSIQPIGENQILLSIYISNVALLLDSLQLWNSFSQRVSTIYMPDKKRTMLPPILSDSLCSLQSNVSRIAFTMDIMITDNKITNIIFSNSKINVYKNFVYEEEVLLKDANYNLLFILTKDMQKETPYLDSISDSHHVVAYWMICMNHLVAKEFLKHGKKGIFRASLSPSLNAKDSINQKTNQDTKEHIPEEVNTFIKIWKSFGTEYMALPENGEKVSLEHLQVGVDSYVHITSPIRRLIDLLNMIQIQQVTGLVKFSTQALDFYERWRKELYFINQSMKAIRRIQNESALLHLCTTSKETMEKKYEGYIIEEYESNKNDLYEYMVYLPELKITSRIIWREKLDIYSKHVFNLYLFHNEEKFKKKIRLHILSENASV